MNISAVFGGVIASGLVVGLVGYAALTRDTGTIAVSTSTAEDDLPAPGPAVIDAPATDKAVTVPASTEASAAPAPPDTPSMPRAPELTLPEMGIVRVDAQGGALVAGTGPASADVVLRLDGTVIASVRTDASGSFVTLFDLPASAEPQLLTLEAMTAGGSVTRAVESVIVAPTLPGPPGIGSAPVADRSTDRPSAGQDIAGQAVPQTDTAPSLEMAEATRLARAIPTELTAPGDDAALTDPTRAAAPVSAAAAPATVAGPPDPGQAPDRSASGTDLLARGTPPSLIAPGPTTPPPRAGLPETSASVSPVAPVPPGTAPVIAGVTGTPPTAPKAPRLIRTGPDGLSVEPPETASQPAVTQDLGIDVISYDTVGAVQLAGRGGLDAELRIYLNNRPVQTVRVGPDGLWNAPLSDVASGVYTLRIDEVAADGTVTARVETPFQRTAPEIAAQARRDGATAITVQPGYTLWALSEGYFGDGLQYVQLFEANRDQIRDPDLIYPGQVFRLPEAD